MLVPIAVFLFQFMVLDAHLSLTFLNWPLRSLNYFNLVDRTVYQWNWSTIGKAFNSGALVILMLTTRSPLACTALALSVTAVKVGSLVRVHRIGDRRRPGARPCRLPEVGARHRSGAGRRSPPGWRHDRHRDDVRMAEAGRLPAPPARRHRPHPRRGARRPDGGGAAVPRLERARRGRAHGIGVQPQGRGDGGERAADRRVAVVARPGRRRGRDELGPGTGATSCSPPWRAAGPAPRAGPGTRTTRTRASGSAGWRRRRRCTGSTSRAATARSPPWTTCSRSTASTRCSTGSCPTRPRTWAPTPRVAGRSRCAPGTGSGGSSCNRDAVVVAREPGPADALVSGEPGELLPLALGAPAGLGGGARG